jgi:hypothetical protein
VQEQQQAEARLDGRPEFAVSLPEPAPPALVPALLPEEAPEQVLAAEPQLAVVAQMRGHRRLTAARWFRQWPALQEAPGSFVSSWPLVLSVSQRSA